jgi:hypothetical protein
MIERIKCSYCGRYLFYGHFSKAERPARFGGTHKGNEGHRCADCVNERETYRNETRRSRAGRNLGRTVAKVAMGGFLPDHWFVIHRNGDNYDNRLENLLVVTGPNREVVASIAGRGQYGLYGAIDLSLIVEQREAVLA